MSDANQQVAHLAEIQEGNQHEAKNNWVVMSCILILPFMAMVGYFTAEKLSQSRQAGLDDALIARAKVLTDGKVRVMQTWFRESVFKAKRVTESRIVQMFVTDVDSTDSLESMQEILLEELPYMEETLKNYVQQNNYVGAYTINRAGEIYLSSPEAPKLPDDTLVMARDVFTERTEKFLPMRMLSDQIVMEIAIPIMGLKPDPGDEQLPVVGVFVVSVAVEENLKEILNPGPLAQPGEKTDLFQNIPNDIALVKAGANKGIFNWSSGKNVKKNFRNEWRLLLVKPEGRSSLSNVPKFGAPSLLPREGEVIAVKQDVPKTPFIILTTISLTDAYAGVNTYRLQAHIIAQMLVLMVIAALAVGWLRIKEMSQRQMATQYKDFSYQINTQMRLLNNINKSVKDFITLKSRNGAYTYSNPAFYNALGLAERDVIGKKDESLFDERFASKLAEMDKEVMHTRSSVMHEDSTTINGEMRYLEIAKAPFRDASHEVVGIVSNIRDVTELVTERKLREKMTKNSMRAMVRIMERYDVHLVKHARYLNRVLVALAENMKLPHKDIMTLDVCSNLSQIGKIFVPRAVLQKNGEAFTPEEEVTYRMHIENTAFILDTVSWGLPVTETVYMMHETLDGAGYPNAVKGDKIPKMAQLLGLCHRFCELTFPRRGFKVYTPEEAIEFLKDENVKYNIDYVREIEKLMRKNQEVFLSF